MDFDSSVGVVVHMWLRTDRSIHLVALSLAFVQRYRRCRAPDEHSNVLPPWGTPFTIAEGEGAHVDLTITSCDLCEAGYREQE